MRCLNFLIIFSLLFSFCSKKNPEKPVSYHPEKWYRIHDDKIRNMGGNYETCLRCHAMEGESPFEGVNFSKLSKELFETYCFKKG
ncbi:MAG: hypothetical protein ABIN20_05920 [candidate division WOR-3 bacterium]